MTAEKVNPRVTKTVIKKKKITVLEKVEVYLNTLNHMFIATVSIYLTWLCYGLGYSYLTMHMWLCTIGVSTYIFKYLITVDFRL